MFDIAFSELLVIGVVALVVIGPERLPKVARTMGVLFGRLLRAHHASGAALELHLADQLLVPLAIAAGPSHFATARSTAHLVTNARTIEQFGIARITIEEDSLTHVRVEPSVAGTPQR